MRHITAIVDVNGKVEVTTQLIGYSGEHNAVSLDVGFTEEGLSLYSTADYFRVVVDGFYSDKLFLNQNNVIQYNLPQDVMKPPKINCQLLGYKGDESELSLILKSGVFSFQVDCSEVPFQKLDKGPDYFEEALHACTTAAESAKSYSDSANNFCELAQGFANSASDSADLAIANSIEASVQASTAAIHAQRAERAAESIYINSFANALKCNKTSDIVSLEDISPISHDVKIQLEKHDSSPRTISTKTTIKVGTNEYDSYNWSDVAPDNIFMFPFTNSGVNVLKVAGFFSRIALAPVIDGQIEVGENSEVYWIDYTGNDNLYLTAEFTIDGGVLSFKFDIAGEGGVSEGWESSYETVLNESQKLTGIAIKTTNPDNSWAYFSVEAQFNYKDVPIKVGSKNFLPYPYSDTTKTSNGITFTDNGDGSIALTGRTTGYSSFYLCGNGDVTGKEEFEKFLVDGETYTISLNGRNDITIVGIIGEVYNKDGRFAYYINSTDKHTFTVDKSKYDYYYLRVFVKEDWITFIDAFNIYPQLELGTVSTEYEPYVDSQTYTANADGALTVPSIYPTMMIYPTLELFVKDEKNNIVGSGENLLTGNIISQPDDWTVENGVYSSSCNDRSALTLEGSYLEAGKKYVISVDVLDFELNNNFEVYRSYAVRLQRKYGNSYWESKTIELDTSGERILIFTPTESGVYNLICFGRNSTSGSVTFTNPQVRQSGINLVCEYNRDINKAFAELQQAIISLGGNI